MTAKQGSRDRPMRIAFFGDSLTSGTPGCSYVAVLRERLLDDTLLNYGKGNDTVVSLRRRISAMQFDKPLDMAFLWIGVNDVPQKDRWLFRAFHTLLMQRRARDRDEFEDCFRATLDSLTAVARRVVVAPPVLKGEDLDNPWNQRLRDLASSIRGITAEYSKAEFLDLQAAFAGELLAKTGCECFRGGFFRLLLDVLTLRTDEQIDAKAAERGLWLTLDGIHLNSAGANLVAKEFAAVVHNHRQTP
jgi:lysophospholipase L1-like esterase